MQKNRQRDHGNVPSLGNHFTEGTTRPVARPSQLLRSMAFRGKRAGLYGGVCGGRELYLIGGSFGLREFAQIRYDVHNLHGKVDPALKEKLKLKQNTVTLESEYEEMPLCWFKGESAGEMNSPRERL
ncbi:cytochrome c oxidase assembly protein COX16 homolog, mitochondrial isoform X2 [Pithys albifrons albifrons]|uniref:cytochrome c oxidase assembly protein COX16 homolog, mitochondrial isoform X2 n=1 Tax=Pithys albifrons albifrons TaxID=3385563 RepID=UPI003A5CF848